MEELEVKEEIVVEQKDAPIIEEVVETKPLDKNEVLREWSKENGVNLFDGKELQKFKEYQDSLKTESDKLNEQLEAYKSKETEWQSKQLEYESKLKASELGIPQDMLEDALKLAGGKVENLAEVVKKYPVFKTAKGVSIGVQDPNNFQGPSGDTELQAYMAANPKIYGKQKK